jgi:hypothetical protein
MDRSGIMSQSRTGATLTREAMGIQPGLPLTVSSGGIEELRRDIQRLMDIEAIKQLKHAYFRCIDTCNVEEMAELFLEDATVHYIGGFYEWKFANRAELLKAVRESFHRAAIGHHNAHTPEIQILSDTEATGIWYFCDNMWALNHRFFVTGSGIYWDEYEKVGERWWIRSTKYHRLYEISGPLQENPKLSAHYLGKFGPEPPQPR